MLKSLLVLNIVMVSFFANAECDYARLEKEVSQKAIQVSRAYLPAHQQLFLVQGIGSEVGGIVHIEGNDQVFPVVVTGAGGLSLQQPFTALDVRVRECKVIEVSNSSFFNGVKIVNDRVNYDFTFDKEDVRTVYFK